MPGKAAKIVVTERQLQTLKTMIASSTCPQGVAQRARMILLAFAGRSNESITYEQRFLSDSPRSGWAGKFSAEQVAQIIAVACEPPEKCGRPVTHWTPRELADEVKKRSIVASISVRQVGRFLKRPS